MGEDIHQRVYVKLKSTGKYINAHDICSWNPEGTCFQDLIDGRNYELFSLFGSRRGNYKELSNAEYGLPKFLQGSIFEEYCKKCGYYGFIWFTQKTLLSSLESYQAALKDPRLYMADNDSDDDTIDWCDLLKPGNKSKNDIDKIVASMYFWTEYNMWIIEKLGKMIDQLKRFDEICKRDTIYSEIFEPSETIFLFFFDC